MTEFVNRTRIHGIRIKAGTYQGKGLVRNEWVFPPQFFNNDGLSRTVQYDERGVEIMFVQDLLIHTFPNEQAEGMSLSAARVSATIEYTDHAGYVAYNIKFTIPIEII